MIKGVAHIAMKVSDMERSLDFYVGKLGFAHAFSIPRDGEKWIEYLKIAPGQFIELFYRKQGDDGPLQNGSYLHLCLETDDVCALADELAARGVSIRIPPRQGSDKNMQAWIDDPDGNPIELMQISPESPQARA